MGMDFQQMATWRLLQMLQNLMWLLQAHLFPANTKCVRKHGQKLFNKQLTPRMDECNFASWWRRASKRVGKTHRKGLNTLIILGAWILWKHRNAGVFEGTSPNVQNALNNLKLEAQHWVFAGARGLSDLGLGRLLSQG
ncbi:hypothetical protein EJB05_39843, partial [Eragrostis curvula]